VGGICDKCEQFFPRLAEDFELAGTWFALKTKVNDENATRPLVVMADKSVDKQGRFIQVFSSKLTSTFKAEECVLEMIEERAEVRTESFAGNKLEAECRHRQNENIYDDFENNREPPDENPLGWLKVID
jgi:hypothetical protein